MQGQLYVWTYIASYALIPICSLEKLGRPGLSLNGKLYPGVPGLGHPTSIVVTRRSTTADTYEFVSNIGGTSFTVGGIQSLLEEVSRFTIKADQSLYQLTRVGRAVVSSLFIACCNSRG